MKEIENKKMYYFVDESGDPNFFNKKGEDLVKKGNVSKVFILGYLEIDSINVISKIIQNIKNEIKNDLYLKDIPSVKKSLLHLHAKDDCPEVRQIVFKAIEKMNIKCHIYVARKDSNLFRKKFNAKQSKFYEYMIEKLFENRLHLYSEIDVYFSKMGNIVREQNMKNALENAKNNFSEKWGNNNINNKIRIFIQEPSQIQPLQIIDYLIWTINRIYEKQDMRYYNYIKDKISSIVDIFDNEKYPNNFYNKKNPFDIKKISPID